ncbi:MAG: tRNA epoxyqueuosine(34) reductase QueG [Anaerolineales bacterium]|nr:tRNA epoxyqueuosine(34) reductase QueG [Anaerolineales bacterium]
MDKHTLTQKVKAKARELGFGLVGVVDAAPSAHMESYRAWLAAGHHGEMDYLASQRTLERRADPRAILPECRSILVLGLPYDNPASAGDVTRGHGRVAAYAWGEDYHDALKPPLQALVAFIEEQVGHGVPNRWYTDSGPLPERELAQRAGLGWIGKNSMLINPQAGSYFLLAEILLGVELVADAPIESDHCGSCTRCIEACPTDCILPDRTLDASRCIAYLTIELKGPIPRELRPAVGDLVFSCDICQEVCPWNQRFAPAAGAELLESRPERSDVDLSSELLAGRAAFNQRYKGSPLKRSKRRGYLRNLAVAAGNSADPGQVPALTAVLREEQEPLARGHAAWALGQLGGEGGLAALQAAQQTETDTYVREEVEAALETLVEKANP